MSAFIDTPRRRDFPKPPPVRRATDSLSASVINIHVHTAKPAASKHADAKGSASKAVAALNSLYRRADAIGSKLGRATDSLDRLASAAHRVADSRRTRA